jgi:hypothetical protein
MIAFECMFFLTTAALFVTAAAIVLYDLWFGLRAVKAMQESTEPKPLRWRTTAALALLAWMPLLVVVSIAAVRARA